VETKKELKRLMFQLSRFLRRDWEGFGLPFLFLVKLLSLLIIFFLIGCSTPSVEVGKVTIVIQEPIRTAHKGEE
jgi:hypothetical protein|tara:strand:+ start:531 stop:752 length:222 start_codon:yes stop_codon:yes gene_type:complete